MDLSRNLRRAVSGALIVAACVAAVAVARRDRALGMSDAGLQGRTKGDPKSAVLLTEYSDFQCPSCRYAKPLIEALMKQYEGKVRFVFRHYPLEQHERARPAAAAAECAARQGRFWPYHDLLFDKQDEWVSQADPRAAFAAFAASLKLSLPEFEACAASPGAAEAVQRDVAEGNAWQVNSTPTLFIGHRRLIGSRQIQLYAAGLVEKELK